MAAAHHAAQRPTYSLPPHPSTNSFPPDDLRLPSIKDLQFHYPPRRQDHPQSSEPPPGYEHNHPQPPERVVRHPQHWARPHPPHHPISHAPQGPPQPPPPSNPVHPPQHQQQPPQNHEPPSKPPEYHHRHENNVYATPGLPLSAQTAPVPGSVNSGPAVRNEDHHQHISHKRARTGDRTPVASLRDTRPVSSAYHYAPSYQATNMPAPSPYHQSASSSVVPPSPVHPTHSTPSPHQVQHHPPLPPQQTYGSYHHAQYSQPPPPPPPRSTNIPHPIPVSAPPPPPVQTPTTPLPPTPTSASAQPTHVLSYTQSAPPSASQEWETPPPPQAHPQLQHFTHYPVPAAHPQPPPPSPPTPSTPVHHVQQQPHSHHPHPPPPPAPPVHSQPPPQTAHLVYPQQAPAAPQAQAPAPAPAQPYTKTTTSVNPTDLDTRANYSTTSHNTVSAPSGGTSPDSTMSELVSLCSILYDFASRYAQLNGSLPGPTPHEIVEMASRANEVVRLLEELRRSNATEGQRIAKNDNMASAEDHRPPKRPWEDMAEEGQVSPDDYQQQEAYEAPAEPVQSTAEQDMELIRTKRATTTAGAAASTGQPKSKYRKRSQRATPPGKCHSCNIRETPEWRRGPDGARTLCNACGLHYAKLMRKQNKMNPGPNGEPPPPIDMDMLRASTRAAEAEKTGGRPRDDGSPSGPPTHHQGSFQVITMAPQVHNEPTPATSPTASEHQQPVATQSSSTSTSILPIPPPPWSTSPPVSGRGYQPTEQSQQSFVRSSVPTSSPR